MKKVRISKSVEKKSIQSTQKKTTLSFFLTFLILGITTIIIIFAMTHGIVYKSPKAAGQQSSVADKIGGYSKCLYQPGSGRISPWAPSDVEWTKMKTNLQFVSCSSGYSRLPGTVWNGLVNGSCCVKANKVDSNMGSAYCQWKSGQGGSKVKVFKCLGTCSSPTKNTYVGATCSRTNGAKVESAKCCF
jgi:hypothetical protein